MGHEAEQHHRRAPKGLGFCFAWCCVEWPVLTQRESLVSQARVGLGGVAGGGLTHWADCDTFPFGFGSRKAIAQMFSDDGRLGPVKATTLGGAFHW